MVKVYKGNITDSWEVFRNEVQTSLTVNAIANSVDDAFSVLLRHMEEYVKEGRAW